MKRRIRMIVLAGIAALLSVALAACGGGGGPASGSGIRGVALFDGGPAPLDPNTNLSYVGVRPLPGLVVTVLSSADDLKEVARTTSDARGEFQIPLPPGNYYLTVIVPASYVMTGADQQYVTVTAGVYKLAITGLSPIID